MLIFSQQRNLVLQIIKKNGWLLQVLNNSEALSIRKLFEKKQSSCGDRIFGDNVLYTYKSKCLCIYTQLQKNLQ